MYNTISGSFKLGRRPYVAPPSLESLANLEVWYNADVANATNFNVAPSDGADISQWKDRSGTGHNANQAGNASVKPNWYANVLNGLGVVRFNGTSESLTINPIAFMQNLPGFTLFVVAKLTSSSGARSLSGTDQGGFRIHTDGSIWKVTTSGGTGTSTAAVDTTQFHVFGLIFDGAASDNTGRLKFRYDRAQQNLSFTGTVGATTSATATTFYVGQTNVGEYFQGDIGEMLMFTRALSESDIINVENYLTNHWAL